MQQASGPSPSMKVWTCPLAPRQRFRAACQHNPDAEPEFTMQPPHFLTRPYDVQAWLLPASRFTTSLGIDVSDTDHPHQPSCPDTVAFLLYLLLGCMWSLLSTKETADYWATMYPQLHPGNGDLKYSGSQRCEVYWCLNYSTPGHSYAVGCTANRKYVTLYIFLSLHTFFWICTYYLPKGLGLKRALSVSFIFKSAYAKPKRLSAVR